MKYENLIDNNNAEKWTLENATEFMLEAYEKSKEKKLDVYTYDFIGELARDMNQYKEIFTYLSNKFSEVKSIHNKIISNCESNCFYNGKKSNIVPSLAIMNLKSNHGWTDRVENNTNHNIKSGSVSIDKWLGGDEK